MNYFYDLTLNFNQILIPFYDWDHITYIRKIPIMKINSNDMIYIANYKIRVTSSKIPKEVIFFSEQIAVAVLFDNYISAKKSYLLFEDEKELLKQNKKQMSNKIAYEIISPDSKYFKTKKESELNYYLIKELKKTKNNPEKLKYLYYECFNKKINDVEYIYKSLRHFLEHEVIADKLFQIFKPELIFDKKN